MEQVGPETHPGSTGQASHPAVYREGAPFFQFTQRHCRDQLSPLEKLLAPVPSDVGQGDFHRQKMVTRSFWQPGYVALGARRRAGNQGIFIRYRSHERAGAQSQGEARMGVGRVEEGRFIARKGKGEQMTAVANASWGWLPARLCHCSPRSLWACHIPSLCLSLLV